MRRSRLPLRDGETHYAGTFNGTIGWVPWQRPGFDLGLQLRKCLDENPSIRGIMLGSHGLFTWATPPTKVISTPWK